MGHRGSWSTPRIYLSTVPLFSPMRFYARLLLFCPSPKLPEIQTGLVLAHARARLLTAAVHDGVSEGPAFSQGPPPNTSVPCWTRGPQARNDPSRTNYHSSCDARRYNILESIRSRKYRYVHDTSILRRFWGIVEKKKLTFQSVIRKIIYIEKNWRDIYLETSVPNLESDTRRNSQWESIFLREWERVEQSENEVRLRS